jgi:hypothetical protein
MSPTDRAAPATRSGPRGELTDSSPPELDFGLDDDLGPDYEHEPRRELGRQRSNGGNGQRSDGSSMRGLLDEARRRVSGNGIGANGGARAPVGEKPPDRLDDEPVDPPGPIAGSMSSRPAAKAAAAARFEPGEAPARRGRDC